MTLPLDFNVSIERREGREINHSKVFFLYTEAMKVYMQIADKKEFGMNEIFCFIFLNGQHFYKLQSFFFTKIL